MTAEADLNPRTRVLRILRNHQYHIGHGSSLKLISAIPVKYWYLLEEIAHSAIWLLVAHSAFLAHIAHSAILLLVAHSAILAF